MTRETHTVTAHIPTSQVLVSSLEGVLPWKCQPQLWVGRRIQERPPDPACFLRPRPENRGKCRAGTNSAPPEAPQLRAEWDKVTPGGGEGANRGPGRVRTRAT